MHWERLKTKAVLVATASFIAAYSYGQTPLQPETTTSSSAGVAHHELRVTNTTPWYCRLTTVNKKAKSLVDLEPGESASTAVKDGDKKAKWADAIPFASSPFAWYAQSADIVITLAALYYSDPTYSQYLGAAVSAVPIRGAGTSSFSCAARSDQTSAPYSALVWVTSGPAHSGSKNPSPSTASAGTSRNRTLFALARSRLVSRSHGFSRLCPFAHPTRAEHTTEYG